MNCLQHVVNRGSRRRKGSGAAVPGGFISKRKRAVVAVVAFAFVAITLCAHTRPAPAAAPHDVILITVDTLRADHLGCYGSRTVKTPFIDALARDGVLFEQAISQVPLTVPSHAAILTGTFPFTNGVRDFSGDPLPPQFRTLAQAFQAKGYATGAVVSSFVLDRSWGLARGFQFYDDRFSSDQFLHKETALVERRGDRSVNDALAWMKGHQQRRFFFWLHLYDPHSPYDPPGPFHSEYRGDLYGGEVAFVDAQLGRLFDWLKAQGLYNSAMIVFTADHGESLGEHGEQEHGFFIYNSTLRVPLIVKFPADRKIAHARVSGPVEITSIAPTILAAAHLHDAILEKQFETPSLPPLGNAPKQGEGFAYSETYYPFDSFGWSPLRSIETAQYEYIEAPHPELYDLDTDPQELHNVADQRKDVAEALQERLGRFLARYKASSPAGSSHSGPSAEAIKKLSTLGYVAYQSPQARAVPSGNLPDPKEKLAEYQTILRAGDAFRAQRYEDEKAILEALEKRDPVLYLVPYMLGEADLKMENWSAAEEDFGKSLALDAHFDQAMMGLAHALASQGKNEMAEHYLRRALAQNPNDFLAWFELGVVQAPTDRQGALASVRKSILMQPNFGPSYRQLALLEIGDHQYQKAAANLQKAIRMGLNDPATLNFLGICYDRTNRPDLAIATYRRALSVDKNFAEAHLNLAYVYAKQGKKQAAQEEYETACHLNRRMCNFRLPQN